MHVPVPVPVPDNDGASTLTVSSTSTATDNPGPGRIIDKYIYQALGRMLENCAGRIAMSTYLSANTIRRTIEGMWYNVDVRNHGGNLGAAQRSREHTVQRWTDTMRCITTGETTVPIYTT